MSKKKKVYKNATNLCNTLLPMYFKEYSSIEDEEKEEIDKNYEPSNLFPKGYQYDKLYIKDKAKSKTPPEETITERVKLRRKKEKDLDLDATIRFRFRCHH